MASVWGAVLVIIGGVLVHLTLGTLFTFGNMSPYVTSYLRNNTSAVDLSYGQSNWIWALAVIGQGLTIFLGGVMERRLGPRLTVLIGAWFQSLGVFLTYFAIQHSFAATFITYGLMFGCGAGVAYAVPMAVGMRWLPKRKGLVSGCVVGGFGGGSIIFVQIQTIYINPENKSPDITDGGNKYFGQEDILEKVPTVFLVLGGCYACMQLLGCLLIKNPPDFEIRDQESAVAEPTTQKTDADVQKVGSEEKRDEKHQLGQKTEVSGTEEQNKQIPGTSEKMEPPTVFFIFEMKESSSKKYSVSQTDSTQREVTPKELFKHREFYILWMIFLLNGQGVSFISSLYKAYGQTFITDDRFLAAVGTFAAVCNAGGRVMWGSISDRFSFKITLMILCALFTTFMLTLRLTPLGGRWMFIVWVGMLFLSFSGSFSIMPTACARTFGSRHYTLNYGILFTSQVVTAPISSALTSSLPAAIGWNGMFYLVAGFSFVSFLLTFLFRMKLPDGRKM